MTAEQVDEEIARIRRLTPHLRDLADVAAQDEELRRLAALRATLTGPGDGG